MTLRKILVNRMSAGLRVFPAEHTAWTLGEEFWAALLPFSHLHSGTALDKEAARQVSFDGKESVRLTVLQGASASKGTDHLCETQEPLFTR